MGAGGAFFFVGSGSSAGFSAVGSTPLAPDAMLMSSIGVSSLVAESCLVAVGVVALGVPGATATAAATAAGGIATVASSSSSSSSSLSSSSSAAAADSSPTHPSGRHRSTASAYC